jgi:chemotaxis protein methyltransferase CheR
MTPSAPAQRTEKSEVEDAAAHTESAEALALRARTQANQGNLVAAREWCEKALAIDKLNARFYYLHALILQEQGALDEAVRSLRRTLYLDPQFVLAYFALGNLAGRQRKRKEAQKLFANALSLLEAYQQEASLPESEGLTAGRLQEIIRNNPYV